MLILNGPQIDCTSLSSPAFTCPSILGPESSIIPICCGLTLVSSYAPRSRLLTAPFHLARWELKGQKLENLWLETKTVNKREAEREKEREKKEGNRRNEREGRKQKELDKSRLWSWCYIPWTAAATNHKCRRFHQRIMKHFFPVMMTDQYWRWLAQEDCGVSLLRDIKKPPGCVPGQPAWTGVWIRWPPKVPSNFNHSVILWKEQVAFTSFR